MSRFRPAVLVLAAACLACGGVMVRAAESVTPVAFAGRAMGTGWTVKIVGGESACEPSELEQRLGERLEELERIFSTYRPQSDLSAFNAVEHTDWVAVPAELAFVAAESRRVSALTGGAFDATVFPLVELWGFAGRRRSGSLPSAAAIATAREHVDWRNIEVQLNPPALRKAQPRISADFSSMAKGFAADQLDLLLTQIGLPNHLVQIGGDLKVKGGGPAGEGWRTAIEQPLEDGRAIARTIDLDGAALSTSGDYRNFFHVGRQRYGHIIDPRTGQPPASSLASVSVVHESCAWSSALATALFVLGPEDGMALARKQGWACLFLVREGTKLVQRPSPAFERLRTATVTAPSTGR